MKIEPLRTSPVHSPVGLALVRILATLTVQSESQVETSGTDSGPGSLGGVEAFWRQDVDTVRQAVRVALSEEELGGDELLYGRAGLLWALLNLRKRVLLVDENQYSESVVISEAKRADLISILSITTRESDSAQMAGEGSGEEESSRAIVGIADGIVRAGLAGSREYQKSIGEAGLPLMWPWHGRFYLGA